MPDGTRGIAGFKGKGKGKAKGEEGVLRAEPRIHADPARGGEERGLAEITKMTHLFGVWPCPPSAKLV